MTGVDGMVTVEVLYSQVDRIGMVPEVDRPFPWEGAASGELTVVEKHPLVRAGRKVGWTIRGR